MVVLRHELAEYWKKYRRVLLVDATHGISITGFKLFTVVVIDSLHKSVLVAYAFIRSESFINLNFVAEALGINAERITVISDDSEGTRLLASTHGWTHFLCQWHYVSNYIRTVKTKGVKHSAAAQYHEIFYRLLSGTDFESKEDFDHQLTEFVISFKSEYPAMTTWLNRFVADTEMVCEFFRYGIFTAGAHTTQRNESIHSLLKMGNLLANALRDMPFYEAYTYITDIVDTMLETSLDELAQCIAKKMHCSNHVLGLLKEATTQCVDLCMNEHGWAVEPQASLPSSIDKTFHPSAAFFKVLSTHIRGTAKHTVTHWVALSSGQEQATWCSCHDFLANEVTCVGIAAALKRKQEDITNDCWINNEFKLSSHPLFAKALHRTCPQAPPPMNEDFMNDDGNVNVTTHSALVARWQNIQAIPIPTSAGLRRSTMNDAFASLRDDFNVHMDVPKYRAFMASIYDLRAHFSGNEGWVRMPANQSDCVATRSCSGAHDSTPPPCNLSVTPKKRGASHSHSSVTTVSEENKQRKNGTLPTVDDRRRDAGDWTLFLPLDPNSSNWICPIPGCMTKAIAKTYQSLYAHRQTHKHKRALVEHPNPPGNGGAVPGIPVAGGAVPGIPVAGGALAVIPVAGGAVPGIPVAGGALAGIPVDGGALAGIPVDGGAVAGIPVDGGAVARIPVDGCADGLSTAGDDGEDNADSDIPACNAVSDSCMQEVLDENPMLASSTMSPQERISAVGAAAMTVVARRSRSKSGHWQRMNCEVLEIPSIAIPASFYLPWSATKGQEQFKVNQYCEDCTNSSLCSVHEAMVPTKKNGDFTHLHMTALRQSGRAVVECGGKGDCFYHSALWLMKHVGAIEMDMDHKQLRVDTVNYLENNWESMLFPASKRATCPIIEMLMPKYPSRKADAGKCVKAYAQRQKLSCRLVANKENKVLVYHYGDGDTTSFIHAGNT